MRWYAFPFQQLKQTRRDLTIKSAFVFQLRTLLGVESGGIIFVFDQNLSLIA
jgi:hypothetical protein